jgi:opacity protein-like surface antigen
MPMQKTVLSFSVAAAALAMSGLASAQQAAAPAAPAAPTLDKVLEASGLAVTGYIDAGYTHADRDLEGGFSPRVFDSQNNSFVLHQVGLQVAKQPKEGFGGLVNVTMGRDAALIHSFDTTTESQFDVTQAYGQYAS